MNTEKKEMVQEICNRLNEHGLVDTDIFGDKHEYTPSSGFGAKLQYMPEENLQKMIDCDVQDWSDFLAVSNAWGRAGALRFTPYILQKDNPSLVMRYNRYLHMFRGYHFQASGSVSGEGDYGIGSYRTDFLTRAEYWDSLAHNGLLAYLLWWAAMIDVGFKFDNFIELYKTDKSVLEKFLAASISYWNGPKQFGWRDIEKYITVGKGNIDIYNRKVYQLTREKGDVLAYMAMGEKTVQVETAGSNLVTIEIPDASIGTGCNLDDEDDRDELECALNNFRENRYHEMLLVMAAKLAGVEINFIACYFLWKQSFMKPINAPEVNVVHDLNQIYKQSPDEF